MRRIVFFICLFVLYSSCSTMEKLNESIDEDQLGFITADVSSNETNLDKKALIADNSPGDGERADRSFENAPPLIPHSTDGFFPIKINDNICLSCHMPEEAEDMGGTPIPRTHFTNLRPELIMDGETVKVPENKGINRKELGKLNNAYFNCSQCHVPQTEVTVHIENLFTPEFREKFGLNKSDLDKKLEEGIK